MGNFLDTLSNYRSVAITGLAKNAGKTECLNYLLRSLHRDGTPTGVTSIGVDGESTDAVTLTGKPEITLFEGTLFVTSESFYQRRRLISEIVDTGSRRTALGRPVFARVLQRGKVILAGPPDTATLKTTIRHLHKLGAKTVLVDGALSRLSLGAPEVTDAVVLATGAAISPSVKEIVSRTAYTAELMNLPRIKDFPAIPDNFSRGIWAVDTHGIIHKLKLPTALALDKIEGDIFRYGRKFFVGGAVTDKILDRFRGPVTLIIRDFSCMFAGLQSYRAFKASGGNMMVMKKGNLVGLTVNPVSPQGFRVDSARVCELLTEATGLPAVDIRRCDF